MIMQILSTDPQGTGEYIRNIRMIPANFESTYTNFYSTQSFNPSSARIFNPLFMTRTQAFNTVRFMDWGRTNGSSQVNWSDRSTLQQAQWTNANGVPVEVMVALANQGRFNPWFTMPHMATDDYVRNYAQYVKNNLSRNQKIYIEYTNEAWNTIFPQTAWANAQGSQASMPGNHWFAQRTVEIIDIWKSVFGSESNRVIGVLGTQASNIWLGMDTINYLKDTGSLSKIDAVAIAPYFAHYLGDPMYQQQMRNLTLDQVFDELTQGGVLKNPDGSAAAPKGALEQSYIYMEHYTHLARSNNLQLLAYEGGQHMVGYWGVENDQQINDLFIGANKDPRMGQLYQQYLTRWNQIGGGLFVNYTDVATPSKWGSWGAMEHLGNNNNPKYAALMQMVLK
jgi:hypothetical protein